MEYKYKSGALKRKEKHDKERRVEIGQKSLLNLGFSSEPIKVDKETLGSQVAEIDNADDDVALKDCDREPEPGTSQPAQTATTDNVYAKLKPNNCREAASDKQESV